MEAIITNLLKGENHMFVVLLSPYASTKKREEVFNWILPYKPSRIKRTLVNEEQVRKQFHTHGEKELSELCKDWPGEIIETLLLNEKPKNIPETLQSHIYVSPSNEQGAKDALLWFSEVFL